MNKTAFINWFVQNQLGHETKFNVITPELQQQIFFTLTRQEELDCSHRDHWANFDFSFSTSYTQGLTNQPWLDQRIQSDFQAHTPAPRWPDGKKFALCLTHDVDIVPVTGYGWASFREFATKIKALNTLPVNTAYKILESLKSLFLATRSAYGEFQRRASTMQYYEQWLKLEDQFGFKSTFYFFPSLVTQPHYWDCFYQFNDLIRFDQQNVTVDQMMQTIHQWGWEIGLHPSYYSALDVKLLKSQKQHTEDALKAEIVSVRQHYLHYNSALTPAIHAEAGFKTDSTQGYNRSTGFRAGTAFPYFCWDHQQQQSLPLLEIPLHIMDVSLFRPDTLNLNEDLAIQHCLELMNRVEQVGGCLTLNWHPNLIVQPIWWNVYKTILEEAHHRQAWGCNCKQVYEHLMRTSV